MLSYEGLRRNFGFMLVQVTKQVESMRALLETPNAKLIKKIQDGDDYIDTQKTLIENEAFAFIRRSDPKDEKTADTVRALSVITSNLERIGDFTVNIARQMQYLGSQSLLRQFSVPAYTDLVLEGVGLIEPALFDRDSSRALRICRIEDELDQLYRADIQEIIAALRSSSHPVEDSVTVLFILHYLERMGDALLNAGEAILFAALGERLKIHQYRVLDAALASTPAIEQSIEKVDLDSIWGTRSGVRIGRMQEPGETDPAGRVLFKEGNPDKLQRERESLQRWEKIAPGLVPAVVEFQRRDQGAALLLEYLDGVTFQEIVLNGDAKIINRAERRIEETVQRLWNDTKSPAAAPAGFLHQLGDRLDDIYRVHPELRRPETRINDLQVPGLEQMLADAGRIEAALAAPFSVFIHGDFNLDNIIYNNENDTLHFVDVHRSRDMDYVQDVSVFLVSNFRLPIFVPQRRRALEGVSSRFLQFARAFAAAHGDRAFEARLALGLIRSFATSTRFQFNRRFARSMYDRALLLLSKLLRHRDRPWAEFRVPENILVY